ncbi:MAG TPA: CHAP domain-containing protein [Ktedonobacterales bacterium]|nr:CHAP domain-containing protein [Ktedonobacterales bacterium]
MLRTDAMWRNGGRWLSLALLGGLAINATPVEAAGISSPVQSWTSFQDGQLCRTWSAPKTAVRELNASIPAMAAKTALSVNTLTFSATSQRDQNAKGYATGLESYTVTGATTVSITHCADQWHIAADYRLISDAPAWVPNSTGSWPAIDDSGATTLTLYSVALKTANRASNVTVMRPVHKVAAVKPRPKPGSAPAPIIPGPGGIGPWTPVPGHPSYGMSDFAGDPYSSMFGVCTWWAWYTRQDEPQLGQLGMAYQWIANARARGMRTGYTPAVGATVVFQPGVQGASGSGHVGHVVQILSGGWFVISEMNFYWNGGGWGRVDYRYVHTGSGVAFIY